MDKGIKKLQKHINKIEKSNTKILDKTLAHAFKLKGFKLSDINCRKVTSQQILLHKDTNNFPLVKQKLLLKLTELQTIYPFITLHFANDVNREAKLILSINWEDYVRISLKGKEQEQAVVAVPKLNLDYQINDMNQKNADRIHAILNYILNNANQHNLKDKSDTKIQLENNTMSYEVTRNYLNLVIQQIIQKYNGMIEVFTISNNEIIIRIHWDVYLSQMASLEQKKRLVQLTDIPKIIPPSLITLPHYSYNFNNINNTNNITSFDKTASHLNQTTNNVSTSVNINNMSTSVNTNNMSTSVNTNNAKNINTSDSDDTSDASESSIEDNKNPKNISYPSIEAVLLSAPSPPTAPFYDVYNQQNHKKLLISEKI